MVYAIIIIILSAADQLIKALVSARLSGFSSIAVIEGFFYIILRYNSGAAWSILAEPAWGIYVLTAVSLLMTLFLLYLLRRIEHKGLRLALALVIAGSTGNLIDRLRLGKVVDYLDFHFGSYVFPTFNLADALIVTGAGLICLMLLTRPGLIDDLFAPGRRRLTGRFKEREDETEHQDS